MIAEAPPAPPAYELAARPAAAVRGPAARPLRWRRDVDTPPAVELRWTPDGKLLAYVDAQRPGAVAFLDPAGSGPATFTVGVPDPPMVDGPRRSRAYAFSPDGDLLALPLAGGRVRLWGVAAREVVRDLEGTGEEVEALAFDRTGRFLATGGFTYTLALWEVTTGRLERKHAQPDRVGHGQSQLAFSLDRKWLVGAGDDHEITLWRVPSLALSSAFDAYPSTSFETDGRVVAYRDRNGLRLWDLASGKRESAGPYWQVAVRPGGQALLARSDDGRLVWIDAATRRARPTGLTFSAPAEAAFSPDGKTLAIARGSSRGIRLYDVGP